MYIHKYGIYIYVYYINISIYIYLHIYIYYRLVIFKNPTAMAFLQVMFFQEDVTYCSFLSRYIHSMIHWYDIAPVQLFHLGRRSRELSDTASPARTCKGRVGNGTFPVLCLHKATCILFFTT